MEKRKKAKEFIHIRGVMKTVLAEFQKRPDYELIKIWDIWEDVVGIPVAQQSKPAAFKEKVLIVHVVSSTWAFELQFLKQDIITKINRKLRKDLVEDIKFMVRPLS